RARSVVQTAPGNCRKSIRKYSSRSPCCNRFIRWPPGDGTCKRFSERRSHVKLRLEIRRLARSSEERPKGEARVVPSCRDYRNSSGRISHRLQNPLSRIALTGSRHLQGWTFPSSPRPVAQRSSIPHQVHFGLAVFCRRGLWPRVSCSFQEKRAVIDQ